jgi:hypothetical protein
MRQRNTSADRWQTLRQSALDAHELSPRAYAAWLVLFARADARGHVCMAVSQLARSLACSRSVASRAVQELIDRQRIAQVRAGRFGRSAAYRIDYEHGAKPAGAWSWRAFNLLAGRAGQAKRHTLPLIVYVLTNGAGELRTVPGSPAHFADTLGVSHDTISRSAKCSTIEIMHNAAKHRIGLQLSVKFIKEVDMLLQG